MINPGLFKEILKKTGASGSVAGVVIPASKEKKMLDKKERLKAFYKKINSPLLTRDTSVIYPIFDEIIADLSPLD